MDNILTFFAKLKTNKISISLDDSLENLRIRGDLKNLSPSEKQEIIENKAELISFLKNQMLVIQAIEPVKKQSSYAISDAQHRLWTLSQIEDASVAYNMPGSTRLDRDIDVGHFRQAINATIDRHEILRTVFKKNEAGEIRQWILTKEELAFTIDYKDFRKRPDKNELVQSYIIEDSFRPFDLEKGPLLRAALLQVEDEEYIFYYNMHHIISDGWSMKVLTRDVFGYYESYKKNKATQPAPLRIQYKDYSAWQLAQLESSSMKAHKDYWLNSLKGEMPLLDLPGKKQRPPVKTYNSGCVATHLNKDLSNKLKDYARQKEGTLFISITVALKAFLCRLTGQEDLILGTPIAGRNNSELEDQIGFYVNALSLRSKITGRDSFEQVYKKVRHTILEAYAHQAYPFDHLVEALAQSRLSSRSAVYDITITFNSTDGKIPAGLLTVENTDDFTELKNRGCRFDIEFIFEEAGEYLSLMIDYNTDIYDAETIKEFVRQFKTFAGQALSDSTARIDSIDYLSKGKEPGQLAAIQKSSAAYAGNKTIVDIFHEQAKFNGAHLSALYGNTVYAYEEVEKLSNSVAHFLLQKINLEREEKVGLLLGPGPDAMACMLGVLKAGGAYVALEPALPENHLGFILSGAGARVLITGRNHIETANRLQWTSEHLEHYLCIDLDDLKSVQEHDDFTSMSRELWDHVGERADDQITGGGWLSSYTGQPISAGEMEEYSMNAYKKLKDSLNPGMRVLEIGCSSGLTLRKVAPEVGLYYGTDLSDVIIANTKQLIVEKGLQNVKLKQLAAHEIFQLEEKEFDLVIINSVIQSFQGHSYLAGVIKESIALLKENGRIFIGDVMDLNKKAALVEDLEAFKRVNKNKGYTTRTDFSSDLFVSRGYFEDLKADEKEIAEVAISEKIRTIENELTKYRYDVILSIDKSQLKNTGKQPHEQKKHKWQYGRTILESLPASNPKVKISPQQLAFIIYTSGAYSRPKGAMIEHKNVVSLFNTATPLFDFNNSNEWKLFHSYTFNFFAWQQARLKEPLFQKNKSYWFNKLSGELPLLDLPVTKQRPTLKTYNGRGLRTFIDQGTAVKLKKFSQENEGDLFVGLLAVWNILMYRYTSQKDIITGALAEGKEDLNQQAGFYINTLALRNEIKSTESFSDFFKKVKENTVESFNHKLYPFDRLADELGLQSATGRNVLEVMFILQDNGKKKSEVELNKDALSGVTDLGPGMAKFNINVTAQEVENGLLLDIIYNEDVYEREMVESLMQHYKQLLGKLLESPHEKISRIGHLSEKEKNELLMTFNDTAAYYPKDKTITDLFEEQAAKTPGNIALVFDDKQLTYKELSEQSNQLAHYLQNNRQIKPDDLVGIKLEISEWTIISMLGILKAGGAYVPIDLEYPQERINNLVDDIKSKLVIDEQELKTFKASQANYSKSKAGAIAKPDNLAYVIYTSGSSGKPKGVMIEHASLVNSTVARAAVYKEAHTFLLLSSVSFDSSVAGIFGTLIQGGRLVLATVGNRVNLDNILEIIETRKITQLLAVPSLYSLLLSELVNKQNSLRVVIVAGEECTKTLVEQHNNASAMASCDLYNEYGPTECTVWASYIKYNKNERFVSSIGRPIANTQVYILNEEENLQAIGVIGEIYIGGAGLARGYLNHEGLTKEKFIKHPFKAGEKIYKTGDLGRWTKDGSLEFMGRKDDQVKIRGYRIELGEIEQALQSHKEIKEAIVLVKTNRSKEKELVAYITASAEQNTGELRAYLKETLPEYMLPAYYVQLETLPLTPNGKADKKALPDPEGLGLTSGTEYVAPQTETEEKLVKLWEKVLLREHIGIKDDFFALGGHSLKAVRLTNDYQKEFSVKISLKDLFAHTTIELHAELIKKSKRSEFIQIEKAGLQESYPVSDAQRRLWILSQFEGGSVAYNMPGSVYLNQDIDIDCFAKAIESAIERHEILRTVFREDGTGEIKQWILEKENMGFEIDSKDFRKEENKEEKVKEYITKDSYKAFDLVHGPLLRTGLLRVEKDSYVFYFNMHHIISDGWSINVLVKDVLSYYEAYKQDKQPALKPLRIQYKDYSAWQLSQLKEEAFKTHKDYWLSSLKGELPLLDLPAAKQRPRIKTSNGHGLSAYIDKATTAGLKKYSEANGGSLFMGLLAAWNILMYRYTSQTDIITGTSIAAREHADIEDQIGFYSNTLALRNEVKPEESFAAFYQSVKDTTLKGYNHQAYPFIRLAEELDFQRDTNRSAVFDIMLFLQNNGEKEQGADPVTGKLNEEEINTISDLGYIASKFDLNIGVKEVGDYLSLQVVYNPDVYDRKMVEGLISHYRRLLNALLENPGGKISGADYLLDEEKHQLLRVFNQANVDYPKEKTIIELFEEQAIKTPANTAVVYGNKKLSYKELDELSNRLAHYLHQNYAIKPDDLVGIQLHRGEWMIVSILGILKAGGAYVPIDPEDSSSRKEHILKDASLKVLITEVNFIHDIDYYEGDVFAIDVEFEPENYSAEKLPVLNTPDHLAYVIYTSGSTGKPKGVMISSRSVVDYFFGILSKTNLSECRSFGLVSTIAADLGNTVIYASLLTGASLHLVAKENILSADNLLAGNLDCIKMTPSHWKALQAEHGFFVPNKCLILGGEQFPAELPALLKSSDSACEVYNHYGPTETTIGKLIRHIDKTQSAFDIPLGKPIGNNQVYILNAAQQLCAVGVAGEICISGDGLARGYLNQEDLTREKFIKNPFKAGARLYRTGDLGCWTSDGNIKFIGRKDDQVKIRGYRIELGEVEHAILKHAQIKEAVVIARENHNKEKELVAYITSKAEQNTSDLRAYLRGQLPEYMLPAYYVQLQMLPITSNGKIDKKALPDPQGLVLAGKVEYVAPRNEVEQKIIEVIADILGKPKELIGVYDNFFDLGISSLGLIKLYTSINKELKLSLKVVSVFEFSNVDALTSYILNTPGEAELALDDNNVSGAMDEMIDLM